MIYGHCSSRSICPLPLESLKAPFFVLFINDMLDYLSDQTKIFLHADDTIDWREIIDWDDRLALQSDIDKLMASTYCNGQI